MIPLGVPVIYLNMNKCLTSACNLKGKHFHYWILSFNHLFSTLLIFPFHVGYVCLPFACFALVAGDVFLIWKCPMQMCPTYFSWYQRLWLTSCVSNVFRCWGHYTNDFPLVFDFWWEISFVILSLALISLQFFTHCDSITVMSCANLCYDHCMALFHLQQTESNFNYDG